MQICFTHDHVRTACGAGDTERSARWLHDALAPTLAGLGHTTHRLCDPAAIHPAEPGGAAQWARMFSDLGALAAVQAACAPLHRCDLIIGFEMTPNQIRALHAAGMRFIDVSIDPIRFAPDLFLQMRTNDAKLERLLQRHHRSAASLQPHAARLRSRLAPPGDAHEEAPAVLFVGQTDIDASLVCGGKLTRIDRFIDAIRALLADGHRLLLKPHPYGRSHPDIQTLRRAFPAATTISDNIYALLSASQVQHVVTLSSGVAREAVLFGKAATALITPDNTRAALGSALVSRHYRIGVEALGPAFWRGLQTEPVPAPPGCIAGGTLRRSVGQNWGYAAAPRFSRYRLAAGQTLGFAQGGDGLDLCTLGWSTPEPAGLWSDGPLATMLVDTGGKPLDLVLDARAFLPHGHGPLTIEIRTCPAASAVQRRTCHRWRWLRLVIPLPAVHGRTEVAFHFTGTSRPVDAGLANDTRSLGLRLIKATLRQRQECNSERSAPLRVTQRIPQTTRPAASRMIAASGLG